MTDYRPLLSKIVRLADRGTFNLSQDTYLSRVKPWRVSCWQRGRFLTESGKDPGVAVRKLLAMLEKGRRDG